MTGHPTPTITTVASLDNAHTQLRALTSNGFASGSPEEEVALVAAYLRVASFLDDSISNPAIGSIFDRVDPDSPILQSFRRLAELYGSRHMFPSTTGTSAVNTAAIRAITRPHQSVVVDRSCHVSVCGGLIESGAMPVWISPIYDAHAGVMLPLGEIEIGAAISSSGATAVVATSPTYHGYAGFTRRIVDQTRTSGAISMIDEAHGGHFRFLSDLGYPEDAVTAGADVVTQSQHKIMSALNQASAIHIRSDDIALAYEKAQALGFQSTSFSLPILMSLEHAILQMATDGTDMWAPAIEYAERLSRGLNDIRGCRVVRQDELDRSYVAGFDPTRVTVNIRGLGLTGWDVEERLINLGVIPEMASLDTVLFLIGPGDRDNIDVFISAMSRISDDAPNVTRLPRALSIPSPIQVLSPRDAFEAAKTRRVPRRAAVGEIAAETIGAYPPGQTVIGPGEQITPEAVSFLEETVASGGHLKRARDDTFTTIEIIEEG